MNTSSTFFLLITLFFSVLFLGCGKDKVQAEKSLDGIWEVTAINSQYGTFTGSSFVSTETVSDAVALGTFNFQEGTVEYTFTRNDSLFEGTSAWTLDLERVNAGFNKVNKFTLSMEDQFLFDVTFEDDTKNAEKDAQSMTLREEPTSASPIYIEVFLRKE